MELLFYGWASVRGASWGHRSLSDSPLSLWRLLQWAQLLDPAVAGVTFKHTLTIDLGGEFILNSITTVFFSRLEGLRII